jgi:predicted phosphodiesterase
MRLAAIADTHGNILALEAVLADLRRHAPDLIVDLGDCLSSPMAAGATADALIALGLPTICGNHDRHLLEPFASMGKSDQAAFVQLTETHKAWLATLPPTLRPADGVFMCHGTPTDDLTYLLEDITPHGSVLAAEATIRDRLGAVDAALVLCAHSHFPRMVQLPGGPLIVNPGSVGCPAYIDAEPSRHIMQTGSPHARYAIADRTLSGWQVSLHMVAYDWHAAADMARAGGSPLWGGWIETGFAVMRPGS